ncbi:MAG: hypothetical protein QG644_224 [Patescibacteria group bacterium]|nr:hypothetical protein [Patescibacteria group bacterium]
MKEIFDIKSKNSGFTLIETMIYIALFALIMTGTIVSIYGILGSSARNQLKAMVQEEGSFLVGKVDWSLNGASSIEVRDNGFSLTITKYDGSVIKLSISPTDGNMTLTEDGIENVLNNSNVEIECASLSEEMGCFNYTESSGEGINARKLSTYFTVNSRTSEGMPYSQDFSTIKYLRK